MTQRIIDKTSEKFRQILSKTSGPIVKRKELIALAQTELHLSDSQSGGLIDRGMLILKKYGIASPEGPKGDRGYKLSENLWSDDKLPSTTLVLTKTKSNIETELRLTTYELEAYNDLLEQIPQEKSKITKLRKDTTEKYFQLHGKLRAINQLIAL
jgi:hypothetical protein